MGSMDREIVGDFPWGLLLVTDADARDVIPSWDSDDQIVTASETALVVRIRHADEGDAVVRVIESLEGSEGECVFDDSVRIASGVLRVSDALGQLVIDTAVDPGLHRVRIFVAPLDEAEKVELVIDSS